MHGRQPGNERRNMLGAIIGDIVGSRFEFNNHKSKDFDLFAEGCFVTDDSIMTLAVSKAIMETDRCIESSLSGYGSDSDYHQLLSKLTMKYMQEIGRKYPNCGYGGMFARWMFNDNPEPYNSFGNGAAMRISPAGFAARTESEAASLSETITSVTHDHDEGIKGAEATAVAIYLARQGYLKDDIRRKITNNYYPINFTIDEIRSAYQFNETCQETVPQAIECFLESESFEDAIRNAISLGGDSDTIAAITGAIAEAYYGIPIDIRNKALTYLDSNLRSIFDEWESFAGKDKEQFRFLTKYIGKLSTVRSYGEWIIDRDNDGTSEHPMQWPFVGYNDLICSFEKEFYQFVESHPEYQLKAYGEILERNGLTCDRHEMQNAHVDTLDAKGVLALIMGAIRAERFCDGALLGFFEDGSILKWLKRLKDIDCQFKDMKISEIIFEIGGFGGYDTYHLLFADRRAYLLIGKFMKKPRLRKKYSIRETEKLIEDWNNLHIEYWKSAYPQEADNLICDGTQWSLFVRHEGSRGIMFGGDNTYPENWNVLLNLFGIDDADGDSDDDDEDETERKPGEIIYCCVSFDEGGGTYYYRTEDESIEVGDRVIVPVGPDNTERIAVVSKIEYFEQTEVPFPLEKVKHIIGKHPDKDSSMVVSNNIILRNEDNHKVTLFDVERPGISSYLTARIEESCLRLEGNDLGPIIESSWCDSDREYFYDFSAEMTAQLHESLKADLDSDDDLLTLLSRMFSGIDGEGKFRKYCEDHKIQYKFFVY